MEPCPLGHALGSRVPRSGAETLLRRYKCYSEARFNDSTSNVFRGLALK